MAVLELEGGPHDGLKLERASKPPEFVWVEGDGTLHAKETDGAVVYRMVALAKAPKRTVGWVFEFAGFGFGLCRECGWHGPLRDGCTVCGALRG